MYRLQNFPPANSCSFRASKKKKFLLARITAYASMDIGVTLHLNAQVRNNRTSPFLRTSWFKGTALKIGKFSYWLRLYASVLR